MLVTLAWGTVAERVLTMLSSPNVPSRVAPRAAMDDVSS